MTKQEIIRKYLGRRFGPGKWGCFLFAKAFWKDQFNEVIVNDYLELLQTFESTNSPKLGDMVICNSKGRESLSSPDHCGIYLGGNEMIHGGHFDGRNEVCIHRLNRIPYDGKVIGYLTPKRIMKND